MRHMLTSACCSTSLASSSSTSLLLPDLPSPPPSLTSGVTGGLRLQKRPLVAQMPCVSQMRAQLRFQLRCHASFASPTPAALLSADDTEAPDNEDDTGLRILGFLAAGGEALSSVVPPQLVNVCYALAAASVCADTAQRCKEHVHKEWGQSADGTSPWDQDVIMPGGGLGSRRREKAAKASRKALERAAVKVMTTVALPSE